MDLRLEIDPHDTLIVHLAEGDERTTVSVQPARAGVRSLRRAVDAAVGDGYGECFWPGSPGGQYWWIFKCHADTVEVVAMWTRGGASLWEHVFRATDGAAWLRDQLALEILRLRIDVEHPGGV